MVHKDHEERASPHDSLRRSLRGAHPDGIFNSVSEEEVSPNRNVGTRRWVQACHSLMRWFDNGAATLSGTLARGDRLRASPITRGDRRLASPITRGDRLLASPIIRGDRLRASPIIRGDRLRAILVDDRLHPSMS